ncbi:MAG: type II secretion system protein [Candidatus Omnitrophica bacterium]|nr:type II secretion system protein [Candidatus Omnitrophota bacterium]
MVKINAYTIPPDILEKRGFTFFEVLVAVVILSAGIAVIFQSFFFSVSAVRYVSNRIEAGLFMDREIDQRKMSIFGKSYVMSEIKETKVVGADTQFHLTVKMCPVPGSISLYEMDVSAAWIEGKKDMVLNRVSYLRQVIAS